MSDDLRGWIDYLHAAAQVPPDAPDYEEAQQAVEEALLMIRSHNRAGSAVDRQEAADADPGMTATFAGNALQEVGGLGGDAMGAFLGAMNPALGQIATPLLRHAGERGVASVVTGGDPAMLDEATADHRIAATLGQMLPTALPVMRGGATAGFRLRKAGGATSAGQASAIGEAVDRLKAQFSRSRLGVSQFGGPSVRTAPSKPRVDLNPSPKPPRDPMDTPTYQRRASNPADQRGYKPPKVGDDAPGGGKYVQGSPTQKAAGGIRVQSPKKPSDLADKQIGVLQQYLAGTAPEDIPAKLESMRALGIAIPADALKMLGLQ